MPDGIRAWTSPETTLLDREPLIGVAAVRPDGSPSPFVTIGHVRVDGDETVRSLRGAEGAWYRAALRTRRGWIEIGDHRIAVAFISYTGAADAVDTALHERYGHDSGVRQMTRSPARDATLVLRPLSGTDG